MPTYRPWAESRNPSPLGIFVDHNFYTLLCTKLISGGLLIFLNRQGYQGSSNYGTLDREGCMRMCHINRSKPKPCTDDDIGW